MRAFFSERPKLFFCNGIIVRELSLARHDPNPGSGTLDPSLLREWIKKAKKGDIGSYQRLYEVFARKVLNFIYRMVNSVEEAEDLTQETFVTVYRKLGSLKDDAKFEPWLFRIARNYVYQRYRSRTPATVPIEEPDDNDKGVKEPADTRKNPDEQFQAKELQDVVQEVINSLPEKYREVFVLSAIQQLSYNEIADIVGRSLPSVKTDIHRARLEVRKKVKHYLKV
ncbi:MAG: RNA polymerase sigma factor SigW [Acidobacteria bacterium]|nr:MAG: RNA polymerase sigma factor SigW [Acidobacteriota bacterium]